MPSTGYGSDKKAKHTLPAGFWTFLVHSEELAVLLSATHATVQTLLTVPPPRTTKALWKEQPRWPYECPVPMTRCTAKKMNRQTACVHVVIKP